jgi:hypothetical protein
MPDQNARTHTLQSSVRPAQGQEVIVPVGKTIIFIPQPGSGGGDIPMWAALLFMFFLVVLGVWMFWMMFHR